jgi:hypothetical protein
MSLQIVYVILLIYVTSWSLIFRKGAHVCSVVTNSPSFYSKLLEFQVYVCPYTQNKHVGRTQYILYGYCLCSVLVFVSCLQLCSSNAYRKGDMLVSTYMCTYRITPCIRGKLFFLSRHLWDCITTCTHVVAAAARTVFLCRYYIIYLYRIDVYISESTYNVPRTCK